MNAVSSALMTGGLVITANVLADRPWITARQAIGTGVYLFLLAALSQADAPLADKLALLVLLGAVFLYAPGVVRGLGVAK